MTTRSLILCALLANHAMSQEMEPWGLPDPAEIIKASNTLCLDQAKSALLAWHYRKVGRTKEEVLSLIPESPRALTLRAISAMRENVEDAYAFPDLSEYTYYSFRSEVCMREVLGAVRMPRLAVLRESVAGCQKVHGTEKSDKLFKCIQGVVRAAEPLVGGAPNKSLERTRDR